MIEKLYDRAVDGLSWVSMAIIFFLIVSICLDVSGRYFFNQPVGWVYEFVEHGLVAIVFLGTARVTRENGHVTVDLLLNVLPKSVCVVLRFLSSFVAAAVTGVLGYYAWITTIDSFRRGVETTGVYPIPRGAMTAVVAVGLCLTCIECLRIAVAAVRGSETEASNLSVSV
jgi:TRAP-type C4-dicarboxylate transport system permease small subunit